MIEIRYFFSFKSVTEKKLKQKKERFFSLPKNQEKKEKNAMKRKTKETFFIKFKFKMAPTN